MIHLVMWSLSEPGYRMIVSTWGLIPATIWIPLEGSEDIAGMSLWLTTLTYTFLHGDWVHVRSNMLFLAVFGPLIEYRMGSGFYRFCRWCSFGWLEFCGGQSRQHQAADRCAGWSLA